MSNMPDAAAIAKWKKRGLWEDIAKSNGWPLDYDPDAAAPEEPAPEKPEADPTTTKPRNGGDDEIAQAAREFGDMDPIPAALMDEVCERYDVWPFQVAVEHMGLKLDKANKQYVRALPEAHTLITDGMTHQQFSQKVRDLGIKQRVRRSFAKEQAEIAGFVFEDDVFRDLPPKDDVPEPGPEEVPLAGAPEPPAVPTPMRATTPPVVELGAEADKQDLSPPVPNPKPDVVAVPERALLRIPAHRLKDYMGNSLLSALIASRGDDFDIEVV